MLEEVGLRSGASVSVRESLIELAGIRLTCAIPAASLVFTLVDLANQQITQDTRPDYWIEVTHRVSHIVEYPSTRLSHERRGVSVYHVSQPCAHREYCIRDK